MNMTELASYTAALATLCENYLVTPAGVTKMWQEARAALAKAKE